MNSAINDELRFQNRIERTLKFAEKLFIHNPELSPKQALEYSEHFLEIARNYAIDKRCEFNGVLRDTEDSAL